jgi:hypothetical protein
VLDLHPNKHQPRNQARGNQFGNSQEQAVEKLKDQFPDVDDEDIADIVEDLIEYPDKDFSIRPKESKPEKKEEKKTIRQQVEDDIIYHLAHGITEEQIAGGGAIKTKRIQA